MRLIAREIEVKGKRAAEWRVLAIDGDTLTSGACSSIEAAKEEADAWVRNKRVTVKQRLTATRPDGSTTTLYPPTQGTAQRAIWLDGEEALIEIHTKTGDTFWYDHFTQGMILRLGW